jgi:hypothetical protein
MNFGGIANFLDEETAQYLSGRKSGMARSAQGNPDDPMQGGRRLEEAARADVCQRTAQECSGATFYLRYKRNCREPVGKDPDAAMAAKRHREIALEGVPVD